MPRKKSDKDADQTSQNSPQRIHKLMPPNFTFSSSKYTPHDQIFDEIHFLYRNLSDDQKLKFEQNAYMRGVTLHCKTVDGKISFAQEKWLILIHKLNFFDLKEEKTNEGVKVCLIARRNELNFNSIDLDKWMSNAVDKDALKTLHDYLLANHHLHLKLLKLGLFIALNDVEFEKENLIMRLRLETYYIYELYQNGILTSKSSMDDVFSYFHLSAPVIEVINPHSYGFVTDPSPFLFKEQLKALSEGAEKNFVLDYVLYSGIDNLNLAESILPIVWEKISDHKNLLNVKFPRVCSASAMIADEKTGDKFWYKHSLGRDGKKLFTAHGRYNKVKNEKDDEKVDVHVPPIDPDAKNQRKLRRARTGAIGLKEQENSDLEVVSEEAKAKKPTGNRRAAAKKKAEKSSSSDESSEEAKAKKPTGNRRAAAKKKDEESTLYSSKY